MLILNPTQATPEHPEVSICIQALLSQYNNRMIFPAGKYLIETAEGETVTIHLTHTLVARDRKKDPSHEHLEVLEPRDDFNGGYGSIFFSLGTIKSEKGFTFFPHQKRVAKDYRPQPEKKLDLPLIRRYASRYPLFPSFHAKPLVSEDGHSILIMHHQGGEDMSELFAYVDRPLQNLRVDLKLELTLNLLRALSSIHKAGYLHRDLKPENILVDEATLAVSIVDLDFLLPIGVGSNFLCGTIEYVAPEVLASDSMLPYSTASDIYALGLVIAQLWGDESLGNLKFSAIPEALAFHRSRQWRFQQNIEPLPDKTHIMDILNGMVHLNPNERWPLDKLIEKTQFVLEEYRRLHPAFLKRPSNPACGESTNPTPEPAESESASGPGSSSIEGRETDQASRPSLA